MKNLLLTVTLFALVAFLQAQDDLRFLSEENKVSGIWFLKAIVKERNLTESERLLEVFPYSISSPKQGTLELKTTFLSEGECIKIAFHLQKTEEPGQYTSFAGYVLFYIYELPVKDHYILYSEILSFKEKSSEGILIGKTPEENVEALEKFKKFIQHKQLLQENIIVPKQREHCVPKHHNAHEDEDQNC